MTEANLMGLITLLSLAGSFEYGYRSGLFKMLARTFLPKCLFYTALDVPKPEDTPDAD